MIRHFVRKDYVKNYSCREELGSEDMKEVYASLTTYKQESSITHAEHIQNVKDNKS